MGSAAFSSSNSNWTHLSASAGRGSRYDVAISPSRARAMGFALPERGADPVAKTFGALLGTVVGPAREVMFRTGPNQLDKYPAVH